MRKKTEHPIFKGFGLWDGLGVLFVLFIIMLVAVSFLATILSRLGLDPRTEGLLIAALQSIFVFIIPALIYSRCVSRRPAKVLDLNIPPSVLGILGVVFIFVLGLPFLNQMIYWNESVHFPASMSGLETSFHEMEDRAMAATEILLSTTSFVGMICGVLIIGVLTGFAEELFFRGALQNLLVKYGIGVNIAIWTSAFIFSFLHFQFFGFIPRLLLGAFFGYLLYWTSSIWVSAFAHALNNSLVVVTSWMIRRGFMNESIESLGVAENGFPFVALLSAVLILLIFAKRKNIFFIKGKTKKWLR